MKKCLVGFLASLVVVACGGGGEKLPLKICNEKKSGEVYFGLLVPLTGSLSSYGMSMERGALLAWTDVVDGGGIAGKKLGLIECDTATDPDQAAKVADELFSLNVMGVTVGPATSAESLTMIPKAKENQKVMISPSATSPSLTTIDDGGFFFRTAMSDSYQGKLAAALAVRENFKKVFVIHRDDAYGTGMKEVFSTSFTASGGTVGSFQYKEEQANFAKDSIDAAASFGPDAIFLISFIDDGAAIINQAISSNLNTKWLLPDGPKDPELISKVTNTAYLEGIIGTAPAVPIGPDFELFSEKYKKSFNQEPVVFVSNMYDAVMLAAAAMLFADNPVQGAAIKSALLEKTSSGVDIHPGQWNKLLEHASDGKIDYYGASGPVNFDQAGDVVSNLEEWSISNGKIVTKACWTPEIKPCTSP